MTARGAPDKPGPRCPGSAGDQLPSDSCPRHRRPRRRRSWREALCSLTCESPKNGKPGTFRAPSSSRWERWADASTELPSDHRVVVICRSGHRSGIVTSALTRAGYQAVNLAGGILAWAAEGRPVVTEQGTPGTVI